MNSETIIFFFLLFGALGITTEILWTSAINLLKRKNKQLKGNSSLWMFFIYGTVFFIILLVTTFFMEYNILIRGLIYMFLIYILEFCSGSILKKFNINPWDYSKEKKHHFKGLICLECAPLWFIEGLLAEAIYLYINAHLTL